MRWQTSRLCASFLPLLAGAGSSTLISEPLVVVFCRPPPLQGLETVYARLTAEKQANEREVHSRVYAMTSVDTFSTVVLQDIVRGAGGSCQSALHGAHPLHCLHCSALMPPCARPVAHGYVTSPVPHIAAFWKWVSGALHGILLGLLWTYRTSTREWSILIYDRGENARVRGGEVVTQGKGGGSVGHPARACVPHCRSWEC